MLGRTETALLPYPPAFGNLVLPTLRTWPAFVEVGNAHAVTPCPYTHVLLSATLAVVNRRGC